MAQLLVIWNNLLRRLQFHVHYTDRHYPVHAACSLLEPYTVYACGQPTLSENHAVHAVHMLLESTIHNVVFNIPWLSRQPRPAQGKKHYCML